MINKDFIPSILDIEASGFGSASYPVEIGVVTDTGRRLCCLIRPHATWQHWDESAEKLHGINHQLLVAKGKLAIEVCLAFNGMLAGKTVYSDGWSHDIRWLRRLYEAAAMECEFTLSPIESIASEEQLMCWDEVKADILARSKNITRHRATNDALLVQRVFQKSAELVANQ